MKLTDRPYQTAAFDRLGQAIKRGSRRIILVAPTGAGKGYMSARLMERAALKDNENVFYAAQRELIFQVRRQLQALDVANNVTMAGVKNEHASAEDFWNAKLCHVVSKDTLYSRAIRNDYERVPEAALVQIDECHGTLVQTYEGLMKHHREAITIGWTATPCRNDGRLLSEYYDDLVQAATYKELQDGGFLTPVKIRVPGSLKGWSRKKRNQRCKASDIFGDIVAEWRKHSQGRSTVIYMPSIPQSKYMEQAFAQLIGPDKVAHVDGYMEQRERDEIMEKVKDGTIEVVTNFDVFCQGVDVPRWKYMICARVTKSFLKWRQMGGRIQRPWQSQEAVIQDHTDNSIAFGYPDEDVEWSLDPIELAENLPRTKRNTVPDEKPPIICVECGCGFSGKKCPECGHELKKAGKPMERPDMTKDELEELKRSEARKATKDASQSDKQKFWDQAMGICLAKNLSIGAAAHIYRRKFGSWPNNQLENVPRSSQWKMTAKQFYADVVKPEKAQAKKRSEQEANDLLWEEPYAPY